MNPPTLIERGELEVDQHNVPSFDPDFGDLLPVPSVVMQALGDELSGALRDDAVSLHSLQAGRFGPAMTRLLRRWAALEYALGRGLAAARRPPLHVEQPRAEQPGDGRS